MMSVVSVLLSLVVVVIATRSMRRQGKLSRNGQMLAIGIFVGALLAVVVLALRNRGAY